PSSERPARRGAAMPRRSCAPRARSRTPSRASAESAGGEDGTCRHGAARVDEGGNEAARGGRAGAVVGVDRVHGGTTDGVGQLALAVRGDERVAQGDDDGGRHVDLTDPRTRREAPEGRGSSHHGCRVVATELGRGPARKRTVTEA